MPARTATAAKRASSTRSPRTSVASSRPTRAAASSSRTPRPDVGPVGRLPDYKAQLATLADTPPSGASWVHELKYDGYRIGCLVEGGRARLISRNGKEWTEAFPEVVSAVQSLGAKSAVLDGEVAILTPDGRTSFQQLQNSFSGGSRQGLVYLAFDLLYLEGRDVRAEPLLARKQLLQTLLQGQKRVRYSEHLAIEGTTMLQNACALGAEGIVSKRVDKPYRGGRNEDWIKTKCSLRQEFVVAGFTDPSGSRVGIGALLLGYYEDERLMFAGKVGTGRGFTAAYLGQLRKELSKLEQASCPYDTRPSARDLKGVHWLKPQRVAEVSFTEWTDDGRIRHPSLQGFREDKPASAVVRERPKGEQAAKVKPVRKRSHSS